MHYKGYPHKVQELYDHPVASNWSSNDSCPCKHHKGMWWSGCTHTLILNLYTRWSAVSFAPWLLYPTESTHDIHLTGGWQGPRADENMLHKKKKSCLYYGLKNLSTVKHTVLAVPAMLSWLCRTEIANLHACQSEYTFFVNLKSPPPPSSSAYINWFKASSTKCLIIEPYLYPM
jgi:hypothetical protein